MPGTFVLRFPDIEYGPMSNTLDTTLHILPSSNGLIIQIVHCRWKRKDQEETSFKTSNKD